MGAKVLAGTESIKLNVAKAYAKAELRKYLANKKEENK